MDSQETTIAFLFTEVEGSARLWEKSPAAMRAALVRHDAILRRAVEDAGGSVFKTVGDSFYAAFPSAGSAVEAALAAQRTFGAEAWEGVEIRVRMAVHAGAVESRDGDYFGRPLNRLARILGLAQGGQVLLSEVARAFATENPPARTSFRDLGTHSLRGLESGERLSQLVHPDLRSDFPATISGSGIGNLPRQLTRFVGRESEVTEIQSLLADARLVTLTGSGGTGKTRLAIQAAEGLATRFRDGLWLVEFSGIRSGGSVASEVASVMGTREAPALSVERSLLAGLGERQALLVLDNCEHVLDSVAALVASILQTCAGVRVLATSREFLGIGGEHVYRVPSLALPEPETRYTPERLAAFSAVRLFVDRATVAQPQFALTAANASAVARVCHDLDGVPLALELAAARIRALPVEKLAQRLGDRFRLLIAGPRTADRRQQTLRGLIDWSYDLLKDPEKALLRTLPAFGGGWTLEAVEAIAPEVGENIDPWSVLDLLQSLVDKSLVLFYEEMGRYRLLETVRQYAWERAEETGELARLRAAHANWFAAWVTSVTTDLNGPDQLEAADRIEAEHDNLRGAHTFLVEARATEAAQRLVADLAPFWEYRGFLTEGATRGLETLTLGDGPERLHALLGTGRLLVLHADDAAVSVYEESLARAMTVGDRRAEADAEHGVANWVFYQKEIEAAERRFVRAMEIREQLGDRPGVAASLHSLGNVRLRQDRLDEAGGLFERALAIRRALGDVRGTVLTIGALSQLAMAREQYDEAERLTHEVVRRLSDLRIRWALAIGLSSLVAVARQRGDLQRAALLAGTRSRVREMTGFPIPEAERGDEDAALANLRDELGEDPFDIAYASGYAKDWPGAVAAALEG